MQEIPKETLIAMYRQMVRIREFEERAGLLTTENKAPGVVHLYAGEEAVAVGVCTHLTNNDYITSTHRGHGHCIAKGGDLKKMMAELYGKATGYCKGKGGSMHIAAVELGMLGANGIVGAGGPSAVGAAWGCRYKRKGQVTVCFFGDGAAAEGAFHEAANFANIHKLPVVFVCENNLWGELMPFELHHPIKDLADLAHGYNMPGVVVDGMDVLAVYETAGEAIARARRGEGPSLLECKTYRFYDHVGRQWLSKDVRPPEQVAYWKGRDPIPSYRKTLIERGVLTDAQAEGIVAEARKAVDEAVEFGEQCPYPEPAALYADVFGEVTA